jgi:hypothetical protein
MENIHRAGTRLHRVDECFDVFCAIQIACDSIGLDIIGFQPLQGFCGVTFHASVHDDVTFTLSKSERDLLADTPAGACYECPFIF